MVVEVKLAYLKIMLKSVEHCDVQTLNSEFSALETRHPNCVFWIRDGTMTKQLYVSHSVESIWGVNLSTAYEIPVFWFTTLEQSNLAYYLQQGQKRHDAAYMKPEANTILYQIVAPNGNIIALKDTAFPCHCPFGKRYIAGISRVISPEQWHLEYHQDKMALQNSETQIQQLFQEILSRSFGLMSSLIKTDHKLHLTRVMRDVNTHFNLYLTRRELECLCFTCQGNTAKQIANILNLSTRTVETHLDNVRAKVNVKDKRSLIKIFGLHLSQLVNKEII